MILKIEDWEFDIDMERTMAYSAAEAAEHCDCAYCRNFYAAVDGAYPELRPFLAQFGIDIEAPDELMPYDVRNEMYYDGIYMVCGEIVRIGKSPLLTCGNVQIQARKYGDGGVHINHNCPGPNFELDVGTAVLPWVLDEPMEETVSPANEPSFLQKMWARLLGKIRSDGPAS